MLQFIDETLRDGPQSLWATRISTQTMVEVAPFIERVGFDRVTVMSAACFEVAVKFMRDDPWERLRCMRRHVTATLDTLIRGRTLFGWNQYPDEVVELLFRCLQRNGIGSIKIFDGLNDISNIAAHCRIGKELGLRVAGILSFSVSPIHTDQHYAERARAFVDLGVDAILVVDASGLLTGERTASLLTAIGRVTGGRMPLEMYSHAASGTALDAYRAALEAGVAAVTTAAEPVANGESQPATHDIARIAAELGIPISLDMDAVRKLDDYMSWVTYKERKPVPARVAYDPQEYQRFIKHQIPGGMISNFRNQLREAGLAHRLDEVIEEVGRVRAELGYPIMITPFSQFVGVQATLNVIVGERYKTVPNEVRLYAQGYYGDSGAPIDPNVLDRIFNGRSVQRVNAGAMFGEHVLDEFRRQNGPFASEEELLLHLFYGRGPVQAMEREKSVIVDDPGVASPLFVLIAELAKQRTWRSVSIEKGSLKLSMRGS
jgi:oxaloacetate decarboxylase alpha subunit